MQRQKLPIENVTKPFLLRKRVPLSQSHPEIAVYWCFKKNCGFGPEDFSAGSTVMSWWICANIPSHIFRQEIRTRVRAERQHSNDHGCPYCRGFRSAPSNSLLNYPQLAREWLTKVNRLSPAQVVAGSAIQGWWRCSKCKQKYKAQVNNRTANKSACPFCAGTKVSKKTSLAARFPQVASEWHATRNGEITPKDVMPFSNKKVWWHCRKNKKHVWQAIVADRTRKDSGCPQCAGRTKRM